MYDVQRAAVKKQATMLPNSDPANDRGKKTPDVFGLVIENIFELSFFIW